MTRFHSDLADSISKNVRARDAVIFPYLADRSERFSFESIWKKIFFFSFDDSFSQTRNIENTVLLAGTVFYRFSTNWIPAE